MALNRPGMLMELYTVHSIASTAKSYPASNAKVEKP